MVKPVVLEVDDLEIVGQLDLPGGIDQPYPTVCICHGIPSGNPPDPSDGGYPLLAEKICREGFAVFIFNFRGTGASGGNLDLMGWSRDLKAAIDYLCTVPEVDGSCLSLLGFSGGAAVSVVTAAQDKRVSSVIACACPSELTFFSKSANPSSLIDHFRRIGAIRDKEFPESTEDWLGGFEMASPIRHVDRIAPRPLLLLHGNRDQTVDLSHVFKLYARAGEPKEIIIVDEAGHRMRQNETVVTIITDWLKFRLLQ